MWWGNMVEKMFEPAFGCAQHPKAGQNTQQSSARQSSTLPNELYDLIFRHRWYFSDKTSCKNDLALKITTFSCDFQNTRKLFCSLFDKRDMKKCFNTNCCIFWRWSKSSFSAFFVLKSRKNAKSNKFGANFTKTMFFLVCTKTLVKCFIPRLKSCFHAVGNF